MMMHMGSFINNVVMSRGGGFAKCPDMSILIHKPYMVKWSTEGEGAKKYPKNCPHGLWMNPYSQSYNSHVHSTVVHTWSYAPLSII